MPKKIKRARDVEKAYSVKKFAEKLRRLADAIEPGEQFRIQVKGKRVNVPKEAEISIAHERGDGDEEIEFQLRWKYYKRKGHFRSDPSFYTGLGYCLARECRYLSAMA
ncbi:MAG: amphi-Trp domain-containing protein [Anaerolineales bacterium]|nr:amphi-Trp domain-containing protein [Anaerolineales bacterium]